MRDCHVRRLAIQAPHAAAAAHGAVLVEDALRTASLPGESSRLLIVRKLHIGAIPAGSNATVVSRRIEAALAQLPVQAVAAADPAAAGAAAVYFADEVEACVQLAVLGARGQAPDAWFWPRAVAGWRNGYGAPYAVRCALGAAARRQDGPDAAAHAIRRVVAALLAAGLLDTALAALGPEDGPVLLRLCGWRLPALGDGAAGQAAHVQPGSSVAQSAVMRRHSARLQRWAAAWGAGDARTLWLAAALLAVEQGDRSAQARAGGDALAQQAGALVEQLTVPPARRTGEAAHTQRSSVAPLPPGDEGASAGVAPSSPPSSPPAGPAASGAFRLSESSASSPAPSAGAPQLGESESAPGGLHSLSGPQASSPAPSAGAGTTPDTAASAPADSAAGPPVWWRGLPLLPTAAAGLWFLLPVLARLGIRVWLDEQFGMTGAEPSLAFVLPWRILAELARRADTPPLDPVWAVMRDGGVLQQGAETEFLKETRFPVSSDNAGQSVIWWCDQVQEWCAALPNQGERGLTLESIVRRRGWLYMTATHIDVFFDLTQADLRLRRLGLDLDPGWLPWLRRVVTFYYEAGLVEVSG